MAGTRATGARARRPASSGCGILLQRAERQQFLVRGAATTSRPVCGMYPAGVGPVRMAPYWMAPYGAGTANPGPYGVRVPSAPSAPSAPAVSPARTRPVAEQQHNDPAGQDDQPEVHDPVGQDGRQGAPPGQAARGQGRRDRQLDQAEAARCEAGAAHRRARPISEQQSVPRYRLPGGDDGQGQRRAVGRPVQQGQPEHRRVVRAGSRMLAIRSRNPSSRAGKLSSRARVTFRRGSRCTPCAARSTRRLSAVRARS